MHHPTRWLLTLAAVCVATIASAQGTTSLPADLSKLPTLGKDKADVVKFLDQSITFVSAKDKNGLETLTGSPDDKTTVVFTCVGDHVVATSITMPIMGAEPAEQDAIKAVTFLRTLLNLMPDVDWTPYPFGQIFRELGQTEHQRWVDTVGEIEITGERARPGFLVFRLVNTRVAKEGYNLGDF